MPMTSDSRTPQLILEELDDLRQGLIENQQILTQFPDDLALQISLKCWQSREQELLNELESSYDDRFLDTTQIRIDGEPVDGFAISLPYFGKVINGFNDVLSAIVEKQLNPDGLQTIQPQEIQKFSRMNLVAMASGSFRIILSSTKPTLTTSPVTEAFDIFQDLLECGSDREKIKEIRGTLGVNVIKKYQHLLEIIYKNNSGVTFYSKHRVYNRKIHSVSKESAKRIAEVITQENRSPQEEITLTGKLVLIDLMANKFKFLYDGSKVIKGTFKPDAANEIRKCLGENMDIKFSVVTEYNDITGETVKKWEIKEI